MLEVFGLGVYDLEAAPWHEFETVVDVGANIGSSAIWLADRAPKARVIAIEPDPAVVDRLRGNLARNELTSRVTVVWAGLGESTGRARLARGYSSALTRTVMTEPDNGETVPMLTLGGMLDELSIGTVDLLKLDCEGAEYDIILGASDECLRRVERIVGEYSDVEGRDPAELSHKLENAGFEVKLRPEDAEAFDLDLFAATTGHGEVPALGMLSAVLRH